MQGAAEVAPTPEVTDPVPFLRALVLARKNLQLYPGGNPAVVTALEHAAQLLAEHTDAGPFRLTFQHSRILIAGEPVEDLDGRYGRFAEDLYRRAVGTLTFQAGVSAQDLRALLGTLNRSVDELLLTGGPAAQATLADVETIAIEHAEGIEIATGDERDGNIRQLLETADKLIGEFHLEAPEGFSRFFLGVSEGDPDRIAALRTLLAAPQRLTLLFERFALDIRRQAAADGGMLVTQLLRVIETAEDIVRDLESEGARQQMYRGLAEMVCGLEDDLKEPLVVQGLLPRIPLRGLEARILRLFPVPELANAFARAVTVHDGAATMLAECLEGLELDDESYEMLSLLVHGELESVGALTPEIETVLNDAPMLGLPRGTDAAVGEARDMCVLLPRESRVADAAVQWQPGEYRKIRREARRESLKSDDVDMLPLLQALLAIEQDEDDYNLLVSYSRRLLLSFLDRGQYTQAMELLERLRRDREERGATFTPRQRSQLDQVLDSLLETGLVNRLLRALDRVDSGSLEARRLMEYLSALGPPLVDHLLDRLDAEESRHIRLIICRTVARLVGERLDLLAGRLRHQQWFVVRNVVAILAEVGTDAVVPLARGALANPEPRVVREALKTLAKVRTPAAVDAIVATLAVGDAQNRASAASWLGIMGEPRAVPALLAMLEPDPYSIDRTVLLSVIEALGRLATPEARIMLEALAARGPWLGRRRRAPVRAAARAALTTGRRP